MAGAKKKKDGKNKGTPKWMYWTPRIASIAMLLFLAVFSLDVFDTGLGFWGTTLAFFIHNIPVIILGIVLWIAWKREIVGGVAFILAGLLYIVSLLMKSPFQWYMLSWSLIIAGPLFAIGILFLMNWKRKKR